MKVPYFGEAVKSFFNKPITEKYPQEKVELPEKFRGKIKFNEQNCVGCGMCIRVCSPGAITKSVENVSDGQKITMHFDLSSCTFCSMCADFCPRKTIELTEEYSMVTTDRKSLYVEGSFIKKIIPKPNVKNDSSTNQPKPGKAADS